MYQRALPFALCLIGCSSNPAPAEPPTIVLGSGVPLPSVAASVEPVDSSDCPAEHWKAPVFDPSVLRVSEDDPLRGRFTLNDALQGLRGRGKILATIDTSLGAIDCELYADRAPNTVANFVGLARGTRPWKAPDGNWVKRPAYDGTTFHRVIKGFMIQGGDSKGTGAGEPGYVIPDEVWEGAKHDRRGLLCTANRGPNTNGAQFFITDGAAAHLDSGYTIFGSCSSDAVIEAIASVPVNGDKPITPVAIRSVRVRRAKSCP